MQMTTHSFTYGALVGFAMALRGTPERPGVVHKKLPLKALIPITDFLKRVPQELGAFDDAVMALKARRDEAMEAGDEEGVALADAEHQEIWNTPIEIKTYLIPMSLLEDLDDSDRFDSMTAAELQVLSPFFQDDLDREHI